MLFKFSEIVIEDNRFEPIDSFDVKSELNPKIWYGDKIIPEIREVLMKICHDFINNLPIKVVVEDIIFTGSNANYNWSRYSDFDLHILIDFTKINNDYEIVRAMFDSNTKIWNKEHNIEVVGYDVEMYVQSTSETHIASGQYSLIDNNWLFKPNSIKFEIDEELIKLKSSILMDEIDSIEEDYEKDFPLGEILSRLDYVWDKIKKSRKSGLAENGEFSIENLIFKLLRRNGYIGKVIKLKSSAFDKQYNV